MGQNYGASPYRDMAEDELERIGMMLEGYLQDMRTFSIDTGHLLQSRIPANRMFKGMNMLLIMAVQYKSLWKEAIKRKDKDAQELYEWFVSDFFLPIIEVSLKNFHPYQKTPRVYLTPRLAPKGGTQEALTRKPWKERFADRLKGNKKPPASPLDTPVTAPPVKITEKKEGKK